MTEDIILYGEGAERAAEILVRRGLAEMIHASPGCACGFNEAGQEYIDPICRPLNEKRVVIRFSIEYPSSDDRHEVSQGQATVITSDIDLAGIDIVLYKSEELMRAVLNRYRDHKWASTVERCDKTAPEWSLARGYSCKLEKGHEGRHVLDK